MGKQTTEVTIKILQSKQRTETVLVDQMDIHPDTRYTPPKYRFSLQTQIFILLLHNNLEH